MSVVGSPSTFDGSSAGYDTPLSLTTDVELPQKAVEENYSEQMADLKKAEEDLHLKEEQYKHEDEARLEKLSAQNCFVEKLDVRRVELMHFIEARQQPPLSLSTTLSHSDSHLNEVSDGWHEQTLSSRTVSSASGQFLATSKGKSMNRTVNGTTNLRTQPTGMKSKQHHKEMLARIGMINQETASAQSVLPEFSVPWSLLSDDPGVKSRSASAPRLSDELSFSSFSDEISSSLLHRLARSQSPHTIQLSSLSLLSVPESIHEDQEDLAPSGRLSVSDVDIRRHQFASADTRNRWSLDEEQLSGQPVAAASIRCLAGGDKVVVITDSGLPSSPEAGRLDSSVPAVPSDVGGNSTKKEKGQILKQSLDVRKSSGKAESGILQKIGATLTSLTRQVTRSTPVKKQKHVSSVRSKTSDHQSDNGVPCDNRPKLAGKAKVETSANISRKPATDQCKHKPKGLSAVAFNGRVPSHSTGKKHKSNSSAQDKRTVPAKMRESFRSFRKRLKLTAEKSLRGGKSDDITVEIFLPKSKVADGISDMNVFERQTDNVVVDADVSIDAAVCQVTGDVGGPGQWTGRFGAEKWKTMEVSDNDCQFSDDSLNGQKSRFHCEPAGLCYEQANEDVNGGQYLLSREQESVWPRSSDTNFDDGSFSEDSLAEDGSSFSAYVAVKELGCKSTTVLSLSSTHDASPPNAVIFSTHGEIHGSICQDVIQSNEHCEHSGMVCHQSGLLPASELQVAAVLRDETASQTGTFTTTHHFTDDSTSASGYMLFCIV